MNHLGLLADQLQVSERTLRRALNEGTLRGERTSPRCLELSASEQDYVLRRWRLLGTLRGALRTEQNLRFALLFGSAARGEDTESSDVDLLVEMRDSSLVRRIDVELKLEGLLEREVNVVALEDAESNPLLLAEAVREGRVIVDRENRWAELGPQAKMLRRRAQARARARSRKALTGVERFSGA